MTRIIITLIFSLLALLTHAQGMSKTQENNKGISLKVSIDRTSTNEGKVYYALYNSQKGFDEKAPFKVAHSEITENQTHVSFENIPNGIYAIICYHDTNNNQQLDFEGYMPIEDYGVSNNPLLMGPPTYEAAKFEVAGKDLALVIKFQ